MNRLEREAGEDILNLSEISKIAGNEAQISLWTKMRLAKKKDASGT